MHACVKELERERKRRVKLVGEQQESRPLLSPSIDDFLSESRIDGPVVRPVTSNTAVLSSALDLVDLSEPSERSSRKVSVRERPSPLGPRKGNSKNSPRRGNRRDETELIHVEVERSSSARTTRAPERVSLESVSSSSPLEKWEEVNLHPEGALNDSRKRRYEKKCTSHHSSSELIWSAEFKTNPSVKNSFEVNSNDDEDHISALKDPVPQQVRPSLRHLLGRHHSQEEEFVRAKAAVESDTEFWDKMQAEWEELARRNWLEEENEGPIPPSSSPIEKGYYFHTNNPYKEWPNAFEEGQQKARDGDLNNAVLLLEAAILQDPSDSEAWQVLGTTQAENENEQAAIVSLQRKMHSPHPLPILPGTTSPGVHTKKTEPAHPCTEITAVPVCRCLDLHHNNLQALMALAVSLTNTGMQQDACKALHRWICHNPRYKHLLPGSRSPLLQGSPTTPRRGRPHTPTSCSQLAEVKGLYQEAVLLNTDGVDPDLQTGLGVLFNLSSEFDKAVEAFKSALSVRPEDYLLWNRLGATLANGDHSEEAVEAYTRALELQPGFIRSRYNLGISCINLGAHKEAASNFLTALNQQRQSQSHQVMSANIWAALRIALSMMDRPELFQAANLGDLDRLMKAFEMGRVM
ncbi:PEX5-related protein isoform X2 [Oncorhynchus mykiss]|uniref:PEX5-related protein isoform X2 n=1 Tax=Oncorhynchus mykiss TaxID=8022 RepID=UPI00187854C7|nr:PEX5-related protein isoform X2 [Oncorhynchus mykiss]